MRTTLLLALLLALGLGAPTPASPRHAQVLACGDAVPVRVPQRPAPHAPKPAAVMQANGRPTTAQGTATPRCTERCSTRPTA